VAPGAKFCGECGTPVVMGAVRPPPAPAAPAGPGPAAVAGPFQGGPVAERRLVTVLFTDLVGFTPFSEGRDAEEVRETLNRYFDIATDVIGRYGGTVEKFIGDAVMAVWGTPTVREDDAERAVRAGLDLVEAVRALGSGINARAGVLTGEAAVTLGAINQGMVAGDLVNTAARLQGVAEPGTVLVGESTFRAASNAIAFEPVGTQVLKGKVAPVPAWRALRVVAERGGRGRSDALEAPFVGRDDELRLLKELFHATGREQRTRLVSVTGIGGIGKSRLAWEFEKYLDGIIESVWWHHGRSPAYGEGVTFWPLGEMIRSRANVAESDDEATTRQGLGTFLDRLELTPSERAWIEPALLEVLGIDTGIGSEQLFGAWRTFFERMSATGTVVLVFEDLHWADSGTLDFIDHLLEWSRTSPILIVTLARPEMLEKRPDWGAGRRHYTSLFLEPLSPSAMRELLAGLVPGLPAAAAHAVIARAEGVPLYAVETVRMLVSDGKLTAADDGRYEPAGDLTDLAVPETLTALIAARLDALDPADRSLVLDASVLGQTFALAGIAAVASLDEAVTEQRLRGLVRRELFVQQADPRSPERGQYAFVQALIREVAYHTLARKDRKSRHLAAARYFEALGTDEIAGALAGHYLAAHGLAGDASEVDALAAQARIALRGAADRASALGAHDQAMGFLNQAIAVSRDSAEQAGMRLDAGAAAVLAARDDAAETLLAGAIADYRGLGDLRGVARAVSHVLRSRLQAYRIDAALALVREVAEETASLGDDPAVLELRELHGRALYYHDEPQRAVETIDDVLAVAEQLDLASTVADALITRGAALTDLGRSWEGLASIEGGTRLAEASGRPLVVARGRNVGALALSVVDPRTAREQYIAVAADARRLGAVGMHQRAMVNALATSLSTGDWTWADAACADLLAELSEQTDRLLALGLHVTLAAIRGREDTGVWEEIAGLGGGDDADANLRANLVASRAQVGFFLGRHAESVAGFREAFGMSLLNGPQNTQYLGWAGMFLLDPSLVAESAAALASTRVHGPAFSAWRLVLRGATAALADDRATGRTLLREGLQEQRAIGVHLDHTLSAIAVQRLLGPSDEVALEAAAAARAFLETQGDTVFRGQLDAATASPAVEAGVTPGG